jgi:hypothetical protein
MLAIGSTPSFDDGALGSFDGSRRVTQCLQWAASPARSSAACWAMSLAHACRRRADRRSLLSPGGARRDGPHPGGMRLQQLDKIYVDVITLRNATTQRAHTFKIHLAAHRSAVSSSTARVPLAAALQVRIVVMLCTAAQSIAIDVSVDDESVGELAPIRVGAVDGARL